jgi:hypothetical protein
MSTCCEETQLTAINLTVYSNEALSQKIGLKTKNLTTGVSTLVDLTGYTVKAAVVRSPTSNVDITINWVPPNPDFHFILFLPVQTVADLGLGVFPWDWLLIDSLGVPKRFPGGNLTVLKGSTPP